MEIKLAKQVIKELEKMDDRIAERILAAVDGLAKIPPEGDIKPLKGQRGRYHLRIGSYRILYRIFNDEIHVTDLGSRGDIYK